MDATLPPRGRDGKGKLHGLALLRGDADREQYLRRRFRNVQEWVSSSIAARGRAQGPRPIRPLYDTQGLVRDPLGPARRHIEGLAELRDNARTSAEVRVHTSAMYGLCEELFEFALESVWASEARRAMNGGGAA